MQPSMLKHFLDKLGIKKEPFYTYEELSLALSKVEEQMSRQSFTMFMAQSAFETLGYTAFIENLMYTSASRICAVWPSRFYLDTPQSGKRNARNYVRSPQALANAVYAGRNGNGGESSGDGYRYRGRGAFHLTFKNNYKACSLYLYGDGNVLVEKPELVEGCECAFDSALWFWRVNNLDYYENNLIETTKKINGSTSTIKAREVYYLTACALFL